MSTVSVDRAKSLSSNAAVTASRYHCPIRGGRRLHDDYEVSSKVLGQGLCGQVVLASHRVDRRRYALKTIRKKNVSSAKLHQLTEEVEIYLALDHPHIARLHNVYETEEEISMLTEYCEGGELYFSLQKRGVYSDAHAAEAARQMLRAVCYLHARNIVHRDLKLENFLHEGRETDSNLHLKLIDFGFAKVWDPDTMMTASCGSIAYVSPDVLLRQGYTNKCDIWSLGVVVWMLLAGYPPFHGAEKVMMENIKAARPDWSHKSRWRPVSEDAVDFVRQLLSADPAARPSAAEAMQHRWLVRARGSTAVPAHLGSGAMLSIAAYARSPKARRALLQLLVQEIAPEETAELREVFLALDRKSTGIVHLQDLKDAIRTADIGSVIGFGKFWGGEKAESAGALDWLFAALDTNGENCISYTDFLAATMQLADHDHEDAMHAAFSRLDVDGSGTIDARDLASVLGGSVEGSAAVDIIAQVDSAGTGEIDFDAFSALLLQSDGAVPATPTATPATTPSVTPDSSPRDKIALPVATASAASFSTQATATPSAACLQLICLEHSPAAVLSEPMVQKASLTEWRSPLKLEDVLLEELPSPSRNIPNAAVGKKAAVGEKGGSSGEKACWRSPQSPLGGS